MARGLGTPVLNHPAKENRVKEKKKQERRVGRVRVSFEEQHLYRCSMVEKWAGGNQNSPGCAFLP